VDEVWSKSHEHRKDGPMGIKHLENKINFTSKQKKNCPIIQHRSNSNDYLFIVQRNREESALPWSLAEESPLTSDLWKQPSCISSGCE